MFNKNFFPTPREVVEKMIDPYLNKFEYNREWHGASILEPSAGKGDILDVLVDKIRMVGRDNVYCIEIELELQEILRDKRYNVVDDDFLKHEPEFNYDLIIMNPPFDKGVDHLLHAYKIQNGGEIVCLLNAETIKNPYTEKRKLLKRLIEEHGSVEFLGNCFASSERKTGVEVAMVRMKTEKVETEFEFDMEDVEKITFDGVFEENSLAQVDTIKNIVYKYEQIKNDYREVLKYKNRILRYSKEVVPEHSYVLKKHFSENDKSGAEEYRAFLRDLKMEVWRYIAKKTKIDRFMTSKVRMDFHTYLRANDSMAVTEKNIKRFISIIFASRGQALDNAIVEVFDVFTKYYKENRVHIEGWKTNEAWKVNKKIVMPYFIKEWNKYNYSSDKFSVSYSGEYSDIDKALCFITGERLGDIITIREALETKFKELGNISKGDNYDNTCESHFFELKFFKKGTVHLKFKDEYVWKEFNKRALKGKNWLGA